MGRKVCFTDSDGQSGTCIRDDENCNDCRFIPNPEIDAHKYMTLQSHISEYVLARKQVNTLNTTAYGLRDLAMSFAKTGNKQVASNLENYANDIDSVIEEIERNLNQVNRNHRETVRCAWNCI